jgi:PmbA protein
MDAVSLAEDTVKKALEKGCDGAEVFIKTAKRLSVEAKNSSVDALESAMDFGMALKVIKKQRIGFSFSTSPDSVKDIIDEAVRGADWTAADKYVDIPNPPLPPFYKGGRGGITSSEVLVLDEKIKNIKEEEIIKSALLLEKAALDFDVRVKKVRKAEVILACGNTTIVNSKGVNFSYESSHLTATITALASDGQDSQTGWDFATSRRLDEINFVSVAESASKKAIDLLGSKRISSVKVPVVFDSSVASDFLGLFSASLSAEAVQKKRSFLTGKVGKNIISSIITVVDDGLMPWKIGTRPVDDEGVPTFKKVVVSNGQLTGYIHNTYTAKKEDVTSTGNAARKSFKNLPGIDVTNLYIEPNPPKPPHLIKSISKGILVLETMGIHTANPISGDFSIGISGLWIDNGEIAYPVKEAVMSGNILELFNRIEDVGDDLRFYGKVGSPSLLIGEIDISA